MQTKTNIFRFIRNEEIHLERVPNANQQKYFFGRRLRTERRMLLCCLLLFLFLLLSLGVVGDICDYVWYHC